MILTSKTSLYFFFLWSHPFLLGKTSLLRIMNLSAGTKVAPKNLEELKYDTIS